MMKKRKPINRHKIFSSLILTALAALLLASLAGNNTAFAGSIKNTAHDLSSKGFDAGENCIICHTPHNSDISVTVSPLWNHQPASTTYDMYYTDDDNLVAQPTGESKLCLSCHDGVTAIDKFGGRTTNSFMSGTAGSNASNEQNDSHPLSILFNSASAAKNPSLYDPATTTVTIGSGSTNTRTGTIAELLLPNGRVQCNSCHDVHNNFVGNDAKDQPFLKITKARSEICLTCHNK